MDKAPGHLPTRSPTAAVIFLHGIGDTANSWEALAQACGAAEVRSKVFRCGNRLPSHQTARPSQLAWIAWEHPSAPLREVTAHDGRRMSAWFDQVYLPMREGRQDQDRHGMHASMRRVHAAIVQTCSALSIAPHRIVLGGFNQGAALALFSALNLPYKLAGVLSLSGWLAFPCEYPAEPLQWGHKQHMPVLASHGTRDRIVPLAEHTRASQALQDMGFALTHLVFDMGHTWSGEQAVFVRRWLLEVLPPGPPARAPALPSLPTRPRDSAPSPSAPTMHGGARAATAAASLGRHLPTPTTHSEPRAKAAAGGAVADTGTPSTLQMPPLATPAPGQWVSVDRDGALLRSPQFEQASVWLRPPTGASLWRGATPHTALQLPEQPIGTSNIKSVSRGSPLTSAGALVLQGPAQTPGASQEHERHVLDSAGSLGSLLGPLAADALALPLDSSAAGGAPTAAGGPWPSSRQHLAGGKSTQLLGWRGAHQIIPAARSATPTALHNAQMTDLWNVSRASTPGGHSAASGTPVSAQIPAWLTRSKLSPPPTDSKAPRTEVLDRASTGFHEVPHSLQGGGKRHSSRRRRSKPLRNLAFR